MTVTTSATAEVFGLAGDIRRATDLLALLPQTPLAAAMAQVLTAAATEMDSTAADGLASASPRPGWTAAITLAQAVLGKNRTDLATAGPRPQRTASGLPICPYCGQPYFLPCLCRYDIDNNLIPLAEQTPRLRPEGSGPDRRSHCSVCGQAEDLPHLDEFHQRQSATAEWKGDAR